MDELDAPDDPEELYRDRVQVPVTVPLMQGDVFAGVVVPGFSSEPILAEVIMHPCSMRDGATLRDRITVAPVAQLDGGYSRKPASAARLWQETADWIGAMFAHASCGRSPPCLTSESCYLSLTEHPSPSECAWRPHRPR